MNSVIPYSKKLLQNLDVIFLKDCHDFVHIRRRVARQSIDLLKKSFEIGAGIHHPQCAAKFCPNVLKTVRDAPGKVQRRSCRGTLFFTVEEDFILAIDDVYDFIFMLVHMRRNANAGGVNASKNIIIAIRFSLSQFVFNTMPKDEQLTAFVERNYQGGFGVVVMLLTPIC